MQPTVVNFVDKKYQHDQQIFKIATCIFCVLVLYKYIMFSVRVLEKEMKKGAFHFYRKINLNTHLTHIWFIQ